MGLTATTGAGEAVQLAREPAFDLGPAAIRPALTQVVGPNIRVRLQPRVMQVLVALARAEGEPVSRDDLMFSCWGGVSVGEDALNRCIMRLRKLSLEIPGSFTVETIPRVGYRLERLRPPSAAQTPVPPSPETAANAELRRQADRPVPRLAFGADGWRSRPVLMIGAAGLVLAALLIVLIRAGSPNAAHERQIAVEPLQVREGDAAAQIVRLGLSNDLARAMVGDPARFSVEAPRPNGAPSRPAQLILNGNAVTTGSELHVQVQLSSASSNSILWSKDFSGDPARADELREQVATQAGAVLNCALSARHGGAAPIGDDATRLYLAACDHISDYDLDAAANELKQVTVLAPHFARAWADLATTQALATDDLAAPQRAAGLAEAAANARRALLLDPNTGLAYYALAHTLSGIGNWSRRVALDQKGLQVEPDGSELNNQLGARLQQVGRTTEALVYLRRSMDLDPLMPVKTASVISALAYAGHFDDAETLMVKAGRIWPRNPIIWEASFGAEAREGNPAKAEAMLRDPDRPSLRDPNDVAFWQAFLQARLNPTAANLDAAVRLARTSPHLASPDEPLLRAYELAVLGRIDLAYQTVLPAARALDDDYDNLLFRNGLQTFRADPRFMTLAKRLGLVSIWRSTGHWPDFCLGPRAPYDCALAAERAPD